MNNRNQYLGMWILYVSARLLLDAGVQPGLRGPLVTQLPSPADGARPGGCHSLNIRNSLSHNWLKPKEKEDGADLSSRQRPATRETGASD